MQSEKKRIRHNRDTVLVYGSQHYLHSVLHRIMPEEADGGNGQCCNMFQHNAHTQV